MLTAAARTAPIPGAPPRNRRASDSAPSQPTSAATPNTTAVNHRQVDEYRQRSSPSRVSAYSRANPLLMSSPTSRVSTAIAPSSRSSRPISPRLMYAVYTGTSSTVSPFARTVATPYKAESLKNRPTMMTGKEMGPFRNQQLTPARRFANAAS